MLYQRFLRLSEQAGDAGEEVLRHSLKVAGRHLIPMSPPDFGEVKSVMGVTLVGPLDSGAWLHSLDPELRQDLEKPMAEAGHTDKLLGWSLPDLEDSPE